MSADTGAGQRRPSPTDAEIELRIAALRRERSDLAARLETLRAAAPPPPSAYLVALADAVVEAIEAQAAEPAPRLGRLNVLERLRRVSRHLAALRHGLLRQAELDRALLRELRGR
jgi:hypothetical protein